MKREYVIERNGRSFVLYAGLLDLAHERGLSQISTTLVQVPSDLTGHVAIVQAVVTVERGTFSGIGDAAPDNVSKMMLPHLIRMAETRAKARALRDAINVGEALLDDPVADEEADDEPRETAREWYGRMAPLAVPHGYKPVAFTTDAPEPFVVDECRRLREFLVQLRDARKLR